MQFAEVSWLLINYKWNMDHNELLSYRAIGCMSQGMQLPEEVAFDIEKDVNRTFPEVDK